MASIEDESMAEIEDDDVDDDDEMEAANMERLKSLNLKLEANLYDYESHKSKISLLQALGNLDELREAREKFSALFPLAPDLWLDWLRDESNLATTEEEKHKVLDLFKRATKDYVDVEIWVEYLQFSLFLVGSAEGLGEVRQLMEQAVAAVGLHVVKGHSIWEVYRSFETSIGGKEEDKQKRVDKLFRRQLTLPLKNMESTMEEYKGFLGDSDVVVFDFLNIIDQTTTKAYEAALVHLSSIEPFEERLTSFNDDSEAGLKVYHEYLEHELKRGNVCRMQMLYERRITQFCLHSQVWSEYLTYLNHNLKVKETILSVNERSIRNCPWDEDLWISYMRSLELFGDASEVLNCFERALEMNFQEPRQVLRLWLSLVDFRCRKMRKLEASERQKENRIESIRSLFVRAINETSSLNADPEQVIRRTWANFEAFVIGQMSEARRIWAEILKVMDNELSNALIWMEYIYLEQSKGDVKHLRKLFIRAFETVQDWHAPAIGYYWLQMEREQGSLAQIEACEEKLKAKLNSKGTPNFFGQGFNNNNQLSTTQTKIPLKKTNRMKGSNKRERPSNEERKGETSVDTVDGGDLASPAKKRAIAEDGGKFKVPLMLPSSSSKNGKPIKVTTNKIESTESKTESGNDNKSKSSNAIDSEERKRTVFLSNLDYDASEEQVKNLVATWGAVEDVRLVTNPKTHRSRGFAYVKFAFEHEAQNALKQDRETKLNSRPVFVSAFDDEKSGHAFGYNTDMEKNKLFVRGLDKTVTQDDLEKLYNPLQGLKEVRLVVGKSGQSKCVAYIDFCDEATASRALIETDGKELKGRKINVAISNPPTKKKRGTETNYERNSNEHASAMKPRLAFLPRALTQKPKHTSTTTAAANDQKGDGGKKSNEDFRRLLLNSKK